MRFIVFYTTNGAAAKVHARTIGAAKGSSAVVYDAGVWLGDPERCDIAVIMPDVPEWQRDRITNTFGDKVRDNTFEPPVYHENEDESFKLPTFVQPKTIFPKPRTVAPIVEEEKEKESQTESANTEIGKKAVHKGGGRWFVMQGEDRISGPHDKAEAQQLASAE